MLQKFVSVFGGDPNKRTVEKLAGIVDEINSLEPEFEKLTDEALRAKTEEFKARLSLTSVPLPAGESVQKTDEENEKEIQDILEKILPEAFAAVREASKRTIGLRHYDVQMLGGVVLHRGQIAEMKTGEGKTLVATLPLYLNALTGRGTHLVTVNDYLARRDARWMAPIFNMLGMSVSSIQGQQTAGTQGGVSFIFDLTYDTGKADDPWKHFR